METVQLLERLIQFKTITTDIAENNRCTDFIRTYLKKTTPSLYTKTYTVGQRKALYACTRRTKKPDLLYVCHTDVVSAPTSQFTPRRKGNRLYARGASDCKVHAAIGIRLLTEANTAKSVGVLFSSDEETGGETTARMAADGLSGKTVLVMDTGSLNIITKQKGILNFTMEVTGRACHSSTPWKGDNAIKKLWKCYHRVESLFSGSTSSSDWKNTIAPTLISGGDVINQIPDHAKLSVNIRFTERSTAKKLLTKIRKKAPSATIRDIQIHPWFMTPRTDPGVRNFKSEMETHLKQKLQFSQLHGATDARHFSASNSSVIMWGIPGANAHSKDEYVDTKMLKRVEEALLSYIQK